MARVHETMLIALPLLPRVLTDAGITLHHVVHVFKGSDLTGTILAHPLRGHGYEQDTPLLMFYPGRYDGYSLNLFSKLADDHYYRAVRLVD